MLWVLFFPLIPPSRKGVMHTTPQNVSSQLALQGRATTRYSSWVSQLTQKKLNQDKIRQRNVTEARWDPPYSSFSILFIDFP
jgi:hypothetical protein